MIYGYDDIVYSLKKLADQRALSHAYIFFGEPQVGKFLCATILANYLENGEMDEPKHPLQETCIVDMAQQKEEEDSESIGIESVRKITHFLHQQPALSPYRVVIIRDGEWLTDQAQNALLKTLEEPPEHSVVILIATDASVFLPAVASRAQKIYFKTLPDEEIENFLANINIQNDIDLASRSANGLSATNDDFDKQNHQSLPITTGSAPSSEARMLQSSKIRSRRASTTGLDFYNSSGIIKDTHLVQKSFGRIGRLKSLIEPTKRDQVIERLVQDICAPKKSDILREKVVDAIIAFDQKNPTNLPAVCEALMIELRSQNRYQQALRETIRLITNMQTLTLSKRIHLKKLLCLIN